MNQVEKIVYNVKEIQVMLGIGRNKAYDLVNSNEFPVKRIDNRIIIPNFVRIYNRSD